MSTITLKTFFNSILDLLRSKESLVGQQALNCIIPFVVYHHLEKNITQKDLLEAKILCEEYNLPDENWIKFSVFKKYVMDQAVMKSDDLGRCDVREDARVLFRGVLAKLSLCKQCFEHADFKIGNKTTIEQIIKALDLTDFSNVTVDVLGDLYEFLLKTFGNTGKGLGQFFTPLAVRKMMVEMVNPGFKPDGSLETIFDPSMGSGGFLISTADHYKKLGASEETIAKSLCGTEISHDTFSLACANLLMVLGLVPSGCKDGDTLNGYQCEKVDVILANPPFALKIKYGDITCQNKDVYIPVETNDSVMMFLQVIIHRLKIGGRAAVVVPNGKQLSSVQFAKVREYLCRTCELVEVREVDEKFANTGVKTSILHFIKRVDEKDVLQGEGKKLTFKGDLIPCEVKMGESVITDMVAKGFRLDVNAYNEIDNFSENGINTNIKLSDIVICEKGKALKRDDSVAGEFPVIAGGKQPSCYHNEFNRPENTILCSASGEYAGYISRYPRKVFATDCFSIKTKDKDILNDDFLFYWLVLNQNIIYDSRPSSSAQKHCYPACLEKIHIPVPPLEVQKQIVTQLDEIEKQIKLSKYKIDCSKKTMKIFLEAATKKSRVVRFEELTKFIKTGKNKPKDDKTGSLYPYYGTSGITGYTDEYLFDGDFILTARNGTIGNCFLTSGKIFPSDHIYVISIEDSMIRKYAFLILKGNEMLDSMKKGATIPNITIDILKDLKIKLPPKPILEQIVSFCDIHSNLILSLEKEIESYGALSKIIMSSHLSDDQNVEEPSSPKEIEPPREKVEVIQPQKVEIVPEKESPKIKVKNPVSGKMVDVGGPSFKTLIKQGYLYDKETNVLTKQV